MVLSPFELCWQLLENSCVSVCGCGGVVCRSSLLILLSVGHGPWLSSAPKLSLLPSPGKWKHHRRSSPGTGKHFVQVSVSSAMPRWSRQSALHHTHCASPPPSRSRSCCFSLTPGIGVPSQISHQLCCQAAVSRATACKEPLPTPHDCWHLGTGHWDASVEDTSPPAAEVPFRELCSSFHPRSSWTRPVAHSTVVFWRGVRP